MKNGHWSSSWAVWNRACVPTRNKLDCTENLFNFSSCALTFISWHVKLFYAAISPMDVIINYFMHLTVLLSPLLHHTSCTWLVSNLQLSQLSRQPKQILFIARKKEGADGGSHAKHLSLSVNYWRISAHFHINLSESVLINRFYSWYSVWFVNVDTTGKLLWYNSLIGEILMGEPVHHK